MSIISNSHVIHASHVIAYLSNNPDDLFFACLDIDPCVWNRVLFKHKVALYQSHALLGAQTINIFPAQET